MKLATVAIVAAGIANSVKEARDLILNGKIKVGGVLLTVPTVQIPEGWGIEKIS